MENNIKSNFLNFYINTEHKKVLIIEKNNIDLDSISKKRYDIVFLNGTLEYANSIIKSNTPELDLINFCKNLLEDEGRLYIAVDNCQGVRYQVGDKSEHCEKIYDSLKQKYAFGKMFDKKELDKIISLVDFKHKKYYYPLPNYIMPNVVFTDELLPNSKNSKLNYNVIYNQDSLIVQDELALLKIFIKENRFVEFTNSYVVELSNIIPNENVKYCSINNMRKDKYSLVLKMDDQFVKKYPKSEETMKHVKNINNNIKILKQLGFNVAETENEKMVVSKKMSYKLLDELIVENINNKQSVYDLVDDCYKYIKERLKPNSEGIVKYGFIDMVFENIFYDDNNNDYIIFDQEWYQENIQFDYIIYRAFNNLYAHNPEINSIIPINYFFEKYNLSDKKEQFEKEENDFQKEIIDEEKQKYYAEQYIYKVSSEELKDIIKAVKKLDKDNVELIAGNKKLNEDNIQLLEGIKKLDRDNVDLINENERLKDVNNNLLRELNKYKQ